MCTENNQNLGMNPEVDPVVNQDVNQAMVQEVSQGESLEQIVASSPNYRTEEEAFAIANGISEEEAIALAASA
ncbi:MAG: hypothetical protein K6E26_06870, partial [Clostridiales bacterium]|nr:hypothetical protein [Clostridiales bacterium]